MWKQGYVSLPWGMHALLLMAVKSLLVLEMGEAYELQTKVREPLRLYAWDLLVTMLLYVSRSMWTMERASLYLRICMLYFYPAYCDRVPFTFLKR